MSQDQKKPDFNPLAPTQELEAVDQTNLLPDLTKAEVAPAPAPREVSDADLIRALINYLDYMELPPEKRKGCACGGVFCGRTG